LSQVAVYSNLGIDFIRFKVVTSDNIQIITNLHVKHYQLYSTVHNMYIHTHTHTYSNEIKRGITKYIVK